MQDQYASTPQILNHIFLIVQDEWDERAEATLNDIQNHSSGTWKLDVWQRKGNTALVSQLCQTPAKTAVAPSTQDPTFQQLLADIGDNEWVAIVFAGTRLPREWNLRLASATKQLPNAATISPLSSQSHLSPFFDEISDSNSKQGALYIDNLVAELGSGEAFECIFPLVDCYLLRKNSHKNYTNLNDSIFEYQSHIALADRLYREGWLHYASDNIGVDRPTSNGKPSLTKTQSELLSHFQAAHPLTGLRHLLTQANINRAKNISCDNVPQSQLPIQLHVMHSWGGGLERWVQDYWRADHDHINWILKSIGTWGAFGHRLALFRHIDDANPIRVWDLTIPIRATAIHHAQYSRVLSEIVAEYKIGRASCRERV